MYVHLPLFQEIPLFKNQLKKEPTLHWYWTHSLSIILSYLLAFVQLTWQVHNG